MSNIQNLAVQASVVRSESEQGANTAERVGSLLEGIVSELGTTQNSITNIYNEFINNGGNTKITMNWLPNATSGRTTLGTLVVNDKQVVIDAALDLDIPIGWSSYVGWEQIYNGSNRVHIGNLVVGDARVTTPVYAPSGTIVPGPSGDDPTIPSGTQEAIDEINSRINEANERADSERERLDAIIDALFTEISSDVAQMDNVAGWIQEHYPQGIVSHASGWSDEIEGYLSRVGIWDKTTNGVTTKWSDILQSWNSIKEEVNAVFAGDDGVNQYIKTKVDQWIDDNGGHIDIGASYATKTDMEKIIKWLYSGLKVSTSADATWTDLISAATDPASNKYIANVHTAVDLLTGTVTSSLASKFNERISELYTEATNNGAETGLFAKFKKDSDDIATIVTYATNNATGTTIASKFQNYQAGLVTRTGLADALAGLTVQDLEGKSLAAITAKVKQGIGTIEFKADQIYSESSDYTIKMQKLLIGDAVDGTVNNPCNVLFHTYGSTVNNHYTSLGFEFVVGKWEDDGNGGINTEEPTNRIRLNRYYSNFEKVLASWIQIGTAGEDVMPNRIDISSATTLRWFYKIVGVHEGESKTRNNYTFNAGDQMGISGESITDETADNPAGSITFGADGTLRITGNVYIDGTLTHTR